MSFAVVANGSAGFSVEAGGSSAVELSAESLAVPLAISSAAVSQAHALSAQSLAQGPAISADAVVQTHVLQGSWPSDPATPSLLSQPLLVDGEPVLVDGQPVMVTQAGVVQPLAISAGAVSVPGISLEAQSVAVPLALSGGQVQQVHLLQSEDLAQPLGLSAGAVEVAHALSAQSLVVPLSSSAAAVGQTHVLSGASLAVALALSGGSVSDGSEPPEVLLPPASVFGGLAAGPDAVIPRDEFLRRFGSVPGSTSSRRTRVRARHRREEALLLGR